jgi:hypothetical protein
MLISSMLLLFYPLKIRGPKVIFRSSHSIASKTPGASSNNVIYGNERHFHFGLTFDFDVLNNKY